MKKVTKKKTPRRKFHPWWVWECYKAGFFSTTPPVGMNADQAKLAYRDFLRDSKAFGDAMLRVMVEWPHSCEQFLTNPSMNRVAWLGQSAMCIATGVPSSFRSGFTLLSPEEQETANKLAQEYLEFWLEEQCRKQQTG